MPPVTPMIAEYGVPTVPFGRVPEARESAAGLTVMTIGPVPLLGGLPESITVTVMGVDPGAVGVPVIVQLAPSVRPAGREPTVMEQL